MKSATNIDTLPKNPYALPTGEIISLPSHCTDETERYEVQPLPGATERRFVTAVRVDPALDDGGHAAWVQAQRIAGLRP